MHPSPSDASPSLPAFVLALVLLGVFTVLGGQVWMQMRMAPGTLLPAGAEAAVASPNNARTPLATGSMVPQQSESGPGWETLTTRQKMALYPLAERWSLISEAQKRRWLTLASNYSTLSEEEQSKFHNRITDWANLSAQQRNQARLNYAVTNRLARDDKRAQWEAYQALSDEERSALAARAVPKPTGAAIALRPVSSRKLAQVPAATEANPSRPNAPKIPPVIDHGPRVAAPVTPMPPHATGTTTTPNPNAAASSGVETAPVAVPTAIPAALPPLGAGSAENSAVPAPQPVTPDTSGLYPQ